MSLAKWIRERRLARNWTQSELSRRVGRDTGAVSCWERGITLPDLEAFQRLCVELQVSADEALGIGPSESGAYRRGRKLRSSMPPSAPAGAS